MRVDKYFGLTVSASDVVPVPADYDGDGRTDVAVFVKSTGVWYWRRSASSTGTVGTYGPVVTPSTGDVPVPADYNNSSGNQVVNDIGAEPAIYRPGYGGNPSVWYIRDDREASGYQAHGFGDSSPSVGDVPMPGNTWGDMKADITVFRRSNNTWRTAGVYGATSLGTTGDRPIMADLDGDEYDERGVYTPSTGTFSYRKHPATPIVSLGRAAVTAEANDIPVQLAPATRLAFFSTADPPPETSSPDITVYGTDTYRNLSSPTASGHTVATASVGYNPTAGATAQFPEWLPSGRIAIGTTQASNNPVTQQATGMHIGVFDPNGTVTGDDAAATYQNRQLPTTTGSTGIVGGADTADLCATASRPLRGPRAGANDLFGISSLPHLPAIPSDGEYPTTFRISDAALAFDAGNPALTSGTGWNTADELYAVGGPDAVSVYPSAQYQLLTVTATSGTYTLTLGSNTTVPISFDADASAIRAALQGVVGGSSPDAVVVPYWLDPEAYYIRLRGQYDNQPAPALTVTPAAAASVVVDPDHGTGRNARMPGECEILPDANQDVVIGQYADELELADALQDLGALGHEASQAEGDAILDSQVRSGRVSVLAQDGTLKASLQIPNLTHDGNRLIMHPRDVSVDPHVDASDGRYHFVVVYDTSTLSFDPTEQVPEHKFKSETYDSFPLQEFAYDDVSHTITAVSEPVVPPMSGSFLTRYNRATFAPDGTVFAASARCSPPGWCFPVEKTVAFRLSGGLRPYETTGSVTWTVTPQPSGSDVIEFPLASGILGAKSLDYDEPTNTLIQVDWHGKVTMLEWDGSSFSQDVGTIDIGGTALAFGGFDMTASKAVIDPVNRVLYISWNGTTDSTDSTVLANQRSYLIKLNLRRLLGA